MQHARWYACAAGSAKGPRRCVNDLILNTVWHMKLAGVYIPQLRSHCKTMHARTHTTAHSAMHVGVHTAARHNSDSNAAHQQPACNVHQPDENQSTAVSRDAAPCRTRHCVSETVSNQVAQSLTNALSPTYRHIMHRSCRHFIPHESTTLYALPHRPHSRTATATARS
jgi:hypothetical protein